MPRILVVDDEKALLDLVGAFLKGEGYDVLTANSGPEALEILEKEEDVDLVLLDVMMPEMDGWDVVREIKQRQSTRDLPIAMLTVKAMSPQYFYSDEVEGIVDYINKPFSKKELLERINKVFEEVQKIEALKKGYKKAPPDFIKEYEDLSKAERLYENLMGSLEFSLLKMDTKSQDYRLLKDALDYGKVLLERIRERKASYERLIKE